MNDTRDHDVPAGTDPSRPEIVVGVDGSAGSSAAVTYALDLAEKDGAPVRLVHAAPDHLRIPPSFGDAVLEAGRDLLGDMFRRAQISAPKVEVRTSLLVGTAEDGLLEAARTAQLVVLGRSARVSRLATGSTAAALAEDTGCAIRIVPADWRNRTSRSEVIVGVKDVATSADLVRRGFSVAAQEDEPLVLLHAWGLPSGYEEILALSDVEAWNRHLAELLADSVRPVREEFPDVPFEVRVVHDRAATALQAASARASFLLVGRSSHHRPVGRLGGITRLLLNVSECPVEIGPAPRTPAPPIDLTLEADGELLR